MNCLFVEMEIVKKTYVDIVNNYIYNIINFFEGDVYYDYFRSITMRMY